MWRMINQNSYCSTKRQLFKKLKLLLFIIMNPAPVVTELKAKVDVPAEVSSQIEAVNEGNQ
jgi:hypothetical protein